MIKTIKNVNEPPENTSVIVYVYSRKTGNYMHSIGKKVLGFWFLQLHLEEVNLPVLNDYEIIDWALIPDFEARRNHNKLCRGFQ